MKHFLSFFLVVLLIIVLLPGLALGQSIEPLAEDMTGYEYIPGTVEPLSRRQGWSHNHYNYGSLPDTVTYQVARELSVSVSSTVEVTLKGMAAELKAGFETTIGNTTTITYNTTFTCAAQKLSVLSTGSERTKVTGTEIYWVMGKPKSSKAVSGTFSDGSYSMKKEYPLN